MTADLPDDLRSLDEKLTSDFKDFAPPADLDARISRNLTRQSRLRFSINPLVIKSAAAVVAIGLLGTFGYVADREMNRVVGESRVLEAESRFDPTFFNNAANRSTSSVKSMIADTRALTAQGKYGEALKTVDQILAADPQNEFATGVKQILSDRATRKNEIALRKEMDTKLQTSNESKIPHADVLTYPADWPDLSARRDQTVREERANGREGETLHFADGHVEWSGSPYVGDQRGNTFRTPIRDAGQGQNSPHDGNDSILLPTDETKTTTESIAPKPELQFDYNSGSNREAGGDAKLKSEFAKAPELSLGINGSTSAPGGGGGGGGGKDSLFDLKIEQKTEARKLSESRFEPAKFGVAKNDASSWFGGEVRGTGQGQAGAKEGLKDNKPADGLAFGDADGDGITDRMKKSLNTGQMALGLDGPVGAPAAPAQVVTQQKVIRSGVVEFEVDSFDTALMTITKLIIEDGGFVASTDSAKLPNGKTRGAITLRIPPDRLDTFVLKLRGLGDLKSQKISAQDVSKMYSDIDSGLRAARAMEQRLLEMIQKGQGAIKDLLAAEKELGIWREKIEKLEGEKRYYDNLIGLSTLTVALQERDIKASAASVETESVNAGVETEDVEKSRAELIKAIDEAKGRIITSDLKKLDAGQFAATIVAEVAPEQSGVLVDRLKQLGKVARLDVDRRQTTVDGTGTPVPGAHVEKKPTRLTVSLYNLANVAPRLTTSATIAADDVQARYREVMASVEKAGGRVVNSSLQRPKQDEVAATLQIEVPAPQAAAMQTALATVGEVMNLQLTDNPDTANVTTAKQGFSLRIISAQSVPARETATLQLAAKDVAGAHKVLLEIAQKAGARVLQSNVVEGDRDRISGVLQLELPRANQSEWDKALAESGEVLTRAVQRSNDTQNTLDSKLRLNLTLFPADRLPPRQTTSATLNVEGAEGVQASFIALAEQLGGRVIDQNVSRDPNGRNAARVVFDVPRDKAPQIIKDLRTTGEIWSMNTTSNPQAPDGTLSRSRFDLNLSEGSALVGKEAGVWSSIRDGLSTSLRGLAWSLQLIIIGVCLVAPWLLVLWGAWKLLRRKKKPAIA